MARALHVRLDGPSEDALSIVKADGLSDSQAVRAALREAADRRRSRAAIRAEVAALAADAGDRAELAAIREQMAALAPDWPA